MADSEVLPSPNKKLKMDVESKLIASQAPTNLSTSIGSTSPQIQANKIQQESAMDIGSKSSASKIMKRSKKEADVGITEFVSPDLPGFSGILKKRYTDFLVNEILPNGEVVHLDNLKPPRKNKPAPSVIHNKAELLPRQAEFGDTVTQSKIRPASYEKVDSKDVPNSEPSQAKDDKLGDNDSQAAVTEPSKPGSSEVHESKPESTSEVTETGKPVPGEKHDYKPEAAVQNATKSLLVNTDASIAEGDADSTTNGADTASDSNLAEKGTAKWQAYAAEEAPAFKLSPGDEASLRTFFNEEIISQALDLFNRVVNSPHRKPDEYGFVTTDQLPDKQMRTKMHQEIRRIFAARLESYTDNNGLVTIAAAQQGYNRAESGSQTGRGRGQGDRGRGAKGRGRGGRQPDFPHKSVRERFAENGGDYVHFSLCKENKDTMEVISFLARQLHLRPGSFQFAGTKDRRAVTVQRVSVYRVFAERLAGLNRILRNARIGNFAYHNLGLELGDLDGNEFLITLRDCKFPNEQEDTLDERINTATQFVNTAMQALVERGFLNYYGLQRFGSFAIRTDVVGMMILKGDFEEAVNAILEYSPESLAAANDPDSTSMIARDDKDRALALDSFKGTGQSSLALQRLPRKFSAESNVIHHLNNPAKSRDFLGALQSIPRNLRIMYAHAYQSVIWNLVASHRWSQYGNKVIEGDLVLVNEHRDKYPTTKDAEKIDADGEIVMEPAADDRTASYADRFERARALSKEEAKSGAYTIFDVVLPMPGYDILYPSYLVGFYETTMGSEMYGNLDPHDMQRPWKEYSLSGSYRKLLARPGKDYSAKVVCYTDDIEQLVETDLDRVDGAKRRDDAARAEAKEGRKARVEKRDNENDRLAVPSMEAEPTAQSEDSKPIDALASELNQVNGKDVTIKDDDVGAGKVEDAKVGEEKAAEAYVGRDETNDETSEQERIDEGTMSDAMVNEKPIEVEQPEDEEPVKLAVILKLQLGSSQYATMALRELMKLNEDPTYKPDYGSGR